MEVIDARSGMALPLGVPGGGFDGDWAPLPVPPSSVATPVPGTTAIAQPLKGQVVVSPGHSESPAQTRPMGSASTLHNEVEIPINSTYNATRGEVSIDVATTAGAIGAAPVTSVTKAAVTGGRFSIVQHGSTAVPLIRLLGRPTGCPRGSAVAARFIHRPRVTIHSKGGLKGKGKNGNGFTHGTRWEIVETCRGTLYRSIQDTVIVTDPGRHKKIALTTGHQYLVRPGHS